MGTLSYLGAVKQPPIKDIAEEILEHLASEGMELPAYDDYPDGVVWGYNAGGAEHGTGRALDFMIDSRPDIGDAIVEFVIKNRRRYGVIHIIWRQRIWSTRVAPGTWRWMADRGSVTENHMDHPHILFDGRSLPSGGAQDVDFDIDPVAPEEKFYQPQGVEMSVKEIQRAVRVKADGMYGDKTKAAVARLQRDLDVPADGLWGPVTEEAFLERNNPKPEPGGGTPAPRWLLPKGHWYGKESSNPKNHSGYYKADRKGVRMYQNQMANVRGWRGMGAVDGVFGEKTEEITKQFQRQKGLKADGLVGIKTWRAAWEEPIT